mmetsp:Transcript_14118/g.20644  ORF Transcript_14118/g.20644 Transcript_14118/m.20644 type:complete len:100 (-) Transcript_14118:893-1192(-)
MQCPSMLLLLYNHSLKNTALVSKLYRLQQTFFMHAEEQSNSKDAPVFWRETILKISTCTRQALLKGKDSLRKICQIEISSRHWFVCVSFVQTFKIPDKR